jgi:hypothetical protein
MYKLTKHAVEHFFAFHKGPLNIVLHVVGFAGLFYSIYKMDWVMFGIFLFIVEVGHIYNHFVGIEKYDFRPKILFWRVTIFIVVVGLFFLLSHYL